MISEALLDNSVVSYILLGYPCVLYEIPGYVVSHAALSIPYYCDLSKCTSLV